MIFRRIYNTQLAQAAYLIGCQKTKQAVVVDPLRDPSLYLDAARDEGLRIIAVTETHIHADFLSGARTLAESAGAHLYLSGYASESGYDRARFPGATWLTDGDQIRVGKVKLDVTHVPGHTPEHIAFLLTDLGTDATPVGLLSGDFLFVGDVGRPDLLERAAGMQGTMTSSAKSLYASLRRLDGLPDFLQLWPGHGAGSACGKALGAMPQSTLGYERRVNWALRPSSEDDFVAAVLAGQPEPPAYFAHMKRLNATTVPPLPSSVTLDEPELMRRALAGDATVVDVRGVQQYAAGHLSGSVNVPRTKSFLTYAGSVMHPDRDLVIATSADDIPAARAAIRELPLIGFDNALGVVDVERLIEMSGRPNAVLPGIAASSLGPTGPSGVTVLDVRNASEWSEGHVPGAVHIPLAQLHARLDELRDVGPIAVHCQGGSRSAIGASLLEASGFKDVSNVIGGYGAWVRAGNRPDIDPS